MAERGRARITLAAEDRTAGAFAAVQQRFQGLQGQIATVGQSLAGFGAGLGLTVASGSLAALVKGAADGLDKLNDLSDATGSSIENLSGLQAVALRTGASFDVVGSALLKLNQALNAGDNSAVGEVLKAIGLSAQELQRLDPAQALLTTAKALQTFGANGNRARAEQLLFGRSLREIAPLLRDVAEAGELSAIATAEQAQAAEAFNRNISRVQASATLAGRAIFNEVAPALVAVGEAFGGAASEGQRFSQLAGAVRVVIETLTVAGAYVVDTFRGVGRELGAVAAQVVALSTLDLDGFNAISRAIKEDNARAKAELDAFVARVLQVQQSLPKADYSNEGRNAGRSLGPVGNGAAAAVREQTTAFERYIERLRDSIRGQQQLTAVQELGFALADGKLGRLTDKQREYAISLAQTLDLAKEPAAFVGPEIEADVLAERQRLLNEVRSLIESSRGAELDRLSDQARELARQWNEGSLSAEKLARGTEVLAQRFEGLAAPLERAGEKVSEFAAQAARNIQDALGDTVLSVVQGKARSIEQIWRNLLERLVSQAIAAKLGEALFGNYGKTGEFGGLVGFLGSAVFGGARANGGPVSAGRAYLVGEQGPEMVVPGASGTVVPNHALGGMVVNNYIQAGVQRGEVLSLIQLGMQQAEANMMQRLRAARVI